MIHSKHGQIVGQKKASAVARGWGKPQTGLFVLLLLFSLLLEACGTATTPTSTGNAAPTAPASTGSVKLRVLAAQAPTQDLATNFFTKEMSQKFNIDFQWDVTAQNGTTARTKRQLGLTSGDYPDLYLLTSWIDQFSQFELLKYANQGIIIPLSDLIEKYAPNIKAAMSQYPDLQKLATAPDGKIYGLPQFGYCVHCAYSNKLWINSQWLKNLNLEMPKTTEELKNVLMAFKTKDPNGNGKADEIPLSGSITSPLISYLMNAFIYYPYSPSSSSYLVLNNGRVDVPVNKAGWKEGLAYIKTLYGAGLIDPGAFTQGRDVLIRKGDSAEAVILGAARTQTPTDFTTPSNPDGRDKTYDAVPPLTGPKGVQFATKYHSLGQAGGSFVLTNKASPDAQIAAIKMLNYLYSTDGQTRGYFGEEGVSWRKPQGGEMAIEKGVIPTLFPIPVKVGSTPPNDAWVGTAQYFQPRSYRDSWVQSTDIYTPEGYQRRLQEATKSYEDKEAKDQIFPYWFLWFDQNLASELNSLQTNLNDYINQSSIQFITGSKDLDKDWDDYLAGLEQLNLKHYLEINQQAYDKFTAKK